MVRDDAWLGLKSHHPDCSFFVPEHPIMCIRHVQAIADLRRQVRDMALVVKNTTPEDIGMVQVPIEDQATDRPLWGFPR